ncbi:FG-GAP repeat-containing protein [Streptomyces mobaraensis NBRC 13819 = DSM 40847]|uniref:FG-GAP repeat-containing protein n=1 Tax=Streptomyces mobaraensis (strain ATCC 29032 / DSM 40847 / JCM 4168 / NBRC 13819 / NCIMB 11159 / IPCR 16-22) TaxID=1223523 RepID=M3CDQ4_STRM1|nr:FG-GAP-like repeat-containing protein [Streptomyces mobaraensis]EMF02141.1 FG-GAP repeat-containing protein [Streptomyces mobaraensis NBRC 13819 = DSM 40847]
MRRLTSLVATALTSLALCAGGLVTATAAQADTVSAGNAPPLRFVSYNLCGNMCGDAKGYDNQRRIDTVADQAATGTWAADQIFLQEVCRPQYDAIEKRLAPLGFHGLYATTLPGRSASDGKGAVCGGADYGMAVLAKGPVVDTKVLDLTVGGEDEPIKSPCVKSYVQNRVNWACSVHLYWAADSTLRTAEAHRLADRAAQWQAEGIPVVLGGDFNGHARSAALSAFYDKGIEDGGEGSFLEADETDKDHFGDVCPPSRSRCRSGDATFGREKIDYLFLSAGHFKDVKADVLPLDTRVSDHRLLRGAAYWSDCGPAGPGAGGILRRDAAGGLFRYTGRPDGTVAGACKAGTGWSMMRLAARDGNAVLAADKAGTLWRYPAAPRTGAYSGDTRVRVSTGWQAMDALLAPGDFTGDGRPDVIGRDAAGDLWLSKGSAGGGYAAPVKIGNGWQVYTALVAPGDFTGDGRPDLIGRDTAGDLWLYRGDGHGGYAPRERVGTGWQIYTALVSPGDLDGDGRPDLAGRDAAGDLWFYEGDGKGGYSPRERIGNGYPQGELLL